MNPQPYGPNTEQVEAFLTQIPYLDHATVRPTLDMLGLSFARHATGENNRARRREQCQAEMAVEDVLYGASVEYMELGRVTPLEFTEFATKARLAVQALVVRDLLAPGVFDTLVAPMRAAGAVFEDISV